MAKHIIKIIIDEESNVEYDIKGIKGKGCIEITEEIDKLSGKIVTKKKTSEYYQSTGLGNTVKASN